MVTKLALLPKYMCIWKSILLTSPVLCVSQQIYGYEDLHMLQSRLPMVSLATTLPLLIINLAYVWILS